VSFHSDQQASELLEVFFDSAEELLQGMNRAGLALEANPRDAEQLRHVRRAVHTLKGDSAACGFRELSELTHRLEDALTPELAKENGAEIASVVLTAADTFREMLIAYRSNGRPSEGHILKELIQRLLAKTHKPASEIPRAATAAWTEYERLMIAEACRRGVPVYHARLHLDPQAAFSPVSLEMVRKALDSVGSVLAVLPEQEVSREGGRTIEAALSSSQSPDWIKQRCQVPSVVERVSLERIEGLEEPQIAQRDALQVLLEAEATAVASHRVASLPSYDVLPDRGGRQIPDRNEFREERRAEPATAIGPHFAAEGSLRVDTARIDAVMNLVGELIIGKSMLQRTIVEFERRYPKEPLRGRLSDALAFQSRVLDELQKSVMKIRMVPVEQLFRRFPRIVRDIARLRDKEIVLDVSGQNTDLDKSVLDALGEPLAHLIRNAADHGIETPAERQASGKPACGTIRLNAYHEGDQVVIQVSDDGSGLDREKIIRRAVDRGIFSAEEALRLSESEALQLIFRAGFSTKDEITEISGRGVGLDVVKSVLEGMKGFVEVTSEAGRGTTFKLLVPLTLASIQALLFRVDARLYAVPLASVIEITRIAPEQIHVVNDHEVVQLRKQLLTLVRLDRNTVSVSRETPKRIFVVVVAVGGRRFGLVVDSLIGEEELVIKPLEDQLIASSLISGASILGDGTVVLILNMTVLLPRVPKVPALGVTT
jgi:two-component system, chemotaxis family, sensor kinase CheA